MCIIFKMDDKRQRIHRERERESVVVRYRRSTIIHIIIFIIWLFINSLNTIFLFLVSVLTPSRV